MMLLTNDQIEPEDLEDLTLYSSFYAYSAYSARYDETPVDTLVRLFYLDPAKKAA